MLPRLSQIVLLVARREGKLLRRSRASRAAAILLLAIAWLPPLLVSLRGGRLGLAGFEEVTPLALAVAGVLLPLLALLAGSDLLAGEIEDGFLVPLISLPIPRSVCYLGKFLGRGVALGAVYLGAFASVALTIWGLHGSSGWQDYAVVGVAGLFLSLSCAGIGAVIGSRGRGRVRAYASSLAVWVLLVFALDAGLLAAVVAMAPPPPESVGHHGHDELVVPPSGSTRAGAEGAGGGTHAETAEGDSVPLSIHLMLLDPVDLFRLSAFTLGPDLGARWTLATAREPVSTSALAVAWIFWIVVPAALGLMLFRRVSLA